MAASFVGVVTQQSEPKVITVGENLDEAIKNCRKELERLCVAKARAEALQMLEFPVDEVRGLVNVFAF
jgi:hypothetical protein